MGRTVMFMISNLKCLPCTTISLTKEPRYCGHVHCYFLKQTGFFFFFRKSKTKCL